MYPVVIFPDAVAALCTSIGTSVGVASGTQIPTDHTVDDEFLLFTRVGGPMRSYVIDDASITLEARAATEAAAHDLIQQARGELHALIGQTIGDVTISRVQEFAGPASLPDPLSSQPRYTMTAAVTVRGHAPSGS